VADWAAGQRIGAAARGPNGPYPGQRPFLQTDHDIFFGREIESAALLELWQNHQIVLAAGPAASGKTSLLQAGVLPMLARNRAHALPPGRVSYGTTFPTTALPRHNPYTLALLRSWSRGEPPTRLVDLTVSDFIRAYAQTHPGPVYAAIDQVDDLQADANPRQAHRDKFLAELADAVQAEPSLHLLLLSRDDTAGLVSAKLPGAARFDLAALTRPGAIEAVAGPAAGAGRPFADGAAQMLITDLQTSRIAIVDGAERRVVDDRVEPSLLQAVCGQLWDSLPADTERISIRDVRLFGDVDKALAAHCGRVIAAVADDFDRPVAGIRRWLQRTFITELSTRGMAYQGVAETARVPNAIAQALEDRHLLSGSLRSGSRWYELLADRLIQPLRDAKDELPPTADPTEYLAAAEQALARDELDVARRHARAAMRSSGQTDLRLHAETESLLGNIAAERGESTEAKIEAESHYRAAAGLFEALRDTPAVAAHLAAVGQLLIAQERPEDALDELKSAIDRMPSDPVFQTDLAIALWQLGESRTAVAVLTSVLSTDGGNRVALRARGEILADLGEARRALLDLDRVTLESWPSTRAARGLALAKLGHQSSANLEVDEAVEEAPSNGAVLLHAARAKALNGDDHAAEDLAWRAVDATDPGLPPHHREVALDLAGHQRGNSAGKLTTGGAQRPLSGRARPGEHRGSELRPAVSRRRGCLPAP
jgi:tetratricopeptide (TPR) repeat protein